MKPVLNAVVIGLIAGSTLAGDNPTTNGSLTSQEERLFQRFQQEMRQKMQDLQKQDPSNLDLSFTTSTTALRKIFKTMIVDPSFGLEWDEVPAPTLVGSNAMSTVNAFIVNNGWNMQTNDDIFDGMWDADDKSKPIRGLPWAVIQEKQFPAVTHDGILYVFFRGFHHDGHGVAYDPLTNHFSTSIDAFKPIGQHWYVWTFDHEFPPAAKQPQEYEGSK